MRISANKAIYTKFRISRSPEASSLHNLYGKSYKISIIRPSSENFIRFFVQTSSINWSEHIRRNNRTTTTTAATATPQPPQHNHNHSNHNHENTTAARTSECKYTLLPHKTRNPSTPSSRRDSSTPSPRLRHMSPETPALRAQDSSTQARVPQRSSPRHLWGQRPRLVQPPISEKAQLPGKYVL